MALGNAAETSANPPVLAKGTTSEETKSIFIIKLRNLRLNVAVSLKYLSCPYIVKFDIIIGHKKAYLMLEIILIILITIAALIALWLSPDKKTTIVVAAASLVIILEAGSKLYDNYQKHQDEKKTTLTGQLAPKKNKDSASDKITIVLGNNVFSIISREDLINGVQLNILGKENPILIKQSKENILVSLTVRSINDRKIIAEIKDNEWEVNPNNYYQRNYDKSGLEVIDDFGNIVLQVFSISPNSLTINGIFAQKDRILIVDNQGRRPMNSNPNDPANKLFLGRLFKYPSKTHLGQRQE